MKSKAINAFHILLVVGLAWGLGYSVARGQEGPSSPADPSRWTPETGFSYQGSLKQSGSAVNANCDFQFGLWDAQSLGTQVGVTQTLTSQSVANGLFNVKLNGGSEFGANPFNSSPRWLAIAVRCPVSSGSYASLSPQELNAAPYALSAPWSGISGKPSNTLIVAKSGGDFNTITAALDSITAASDTNRYLVKVMPGVYTETLWMKAYVDIEGSGELATKITYWGFNDTANGTLRGVNNAEVRFLTVANTGQAGSGNAIAIYNGVASPRLTHITVSAAGGASNYGVYNSNSSPAMTNVIANATGGANSYGVYNNFSSAPAMTNVTASVSGGTNNYGVYNTNASAAVMTNVTASGSGGTNSYGVYNLSSAPAMTNVAASASDGDNNYGVYNFTSSPAMTKVTASASAGINVYGVYNYSSSPAMTNVIASAAGRTSSYGVYNSFSSPAMTNVTASATGDASNYGVYNSSCAALVINNSVLRGSGGLNNYGLYNDNTIGVSKVSVNNSQITGSSNTIYNTTPFKTYVGATLLEGGIVSNAGTLTCVGVYSGSYLALNATCQ